MPVSQIVVSRDGHVSVRVRTLGSQSLSLWKVSTGGLSSGFHPPSLPVTRPARGSLQVTLTPPGSLKEMPRTTVLVHLSSGRCSHRRDSKGRTHGRNGLCVLSSHHDSLVSSSCSGVPCHWQWPGSR
eukprot:819831-Rhodomonas_salina.1